MDRHPLRRRSSFLEVTVPDGYYRALVEEAMIERRVIRIVTTVTPVSRRDGSVEGVLLEFTKAA